MTDEDDLDAVRGTTFKPCGHVSLWRSDDPKTARGLIDAILALVADGMPDNARFSFDRDWDSGAVDGIDFECERPETDGEVRARLYVKKLRERAERRDYERLRAKFDPPPKNEQ